MMMEQQWAVLVMGIMLVVKEIMESLLLELVQLALVIFRVILAAMP